MSNLRKYDIHFDREPVPLAIGIRTDDLNDFLTNLATPGFVLVPGTGTWIAAERVLVVVDKGLA